MVKESYNLKKREKEALVPLVMHSVFGRFSLKGNNSNKKQLKQYIIAKKTKIYDLKYSMLGKHKKNFNRTTKYNHIDDHILTNVLSFLSSSKPQTR